MTPKRFVQPMVARDPHEGHRAATPLELLFDLCFVVAIAQAAVGLHHGLGEAHFGAAIGGYLLVFFAIWWAWMGFTWFASAYDTDDGPYRVLVLIQIAGVLVLAAGVPRASAGDFGLITLGYTIMRVGLVALWVRAAGADRPRRRTALRYVASIAVCQVGWLALLLVPPELWVFGWLVLAPLELAGPMWAESAGPTSWHPHHVAERHGLLMVIVLGESVLAATLAVQTALDAGEVSVDLLSLAGGGLLTLFGLWWLYFARSPHGTLASNRGAFRWSYGHFPLFLSAAAIGAALGVCVDALAGRGHLTPAAASCVLSVPVALTLLGIWLIQIRPAGDRGPAYPIAAALVLAAALVPQAPLIIGVILAGLVLATARHPTST